MTYASKEDLFTIGDVVDAEDFELPNGLTVKLRGLTGFEVHLMRKTAGDNGEMADAVALSMGVVEPKLTKDEALHFMKTRPAGETTAIVGRIRDLSGLNDDAPKAAYKSVRGQLAQ